MAHILIMPRQGNTVESCIITDWKVKEGEMVTTETAVCEVETDKASFEVPAGAAGMVLAILAKAGDDVPVLAPIAVIGEPGENWAAELGNMGKETSHGGTEAQISVGEVKETESLPSSPRASVPLCDINSERAISPRARNLAEREALPAETLAGTGPGGRIIERDVITALENRPALTAAAKAVGGTVPASGSGIGGRVTVEDIGWLAKDMALPAGQSSPLPIPHSSPLPPRIHRNSHQGNPQSYFRPYVQVAGGKRAIYAQFRRTCFEASGSAFQNEGFTGFLRGAWSFKNNSERSYPVCGITPAPSLSVYERPQNRRYIKNF